MVAPGKKTAATKATDKKNAVKKAPAKEDTTKDDVKHGENFGVNSPCTFWRGLGIGNYKGFGNDIENDISKSESGGELSQNLDCPKCRKPIVLSLGLSQSPPNEM